MKATAILLALSLLVPGTALEAAAKGKGARVRVYTSEKKYTGELVALNSDLLVIKEKESGEYLGFPPETVESVHLRKSKAGTGVLTGFLTGGALTGLIYLAIPDSAGSVGEALGIALVSTVILATAVVFTVVLSVSGGLIGSLLGWKKIKLHRMDEVERAMALRQLTPLARYGSAFPDELRSLVRIVLPR